MKLNFTNILPFAFASVLFSCQQVDIAESGISDEVEMNLFDLHEFIYRGVKELLSNKQEVSNIQFKMVPVSSWKTTFSTF